MDLGAASQALRSRRNKLTPRVYVDLHFESASGCWRARVDANTKDESVRKVLRRWPDARLVKVSK